MHRPSPPPNCSSKDVQLQREKKEERELAKMKYLSCQRQCVCFIQKDKREGRETFNSLFVLVDDVEVSIHGERAMDKAYEQHLLPESRGPDRAAPQGQRCPSECAHDTIRGLAHSVGQILRVCGGEQLLRAKGGEERIKECLGRHSALGLKVGCRDPSMRVEL